ncbi:hypothetical protein HYO33_15070 [Vibrio parahaemolyticus]|uniref:hypothetical protein n=1 Tax=Vibrio parahaemolyticus TaxID=670 RepID=UPI0005B436AA|nr:hypothetical protein [Vibrio parahaemolyticus]EJG0765544.1 hypothetical protein [Vibrio parahaemolyticus O5:K30]EHK6024970.1 hypothetical protein [Vibrio parahaemolyticus]EJA3094838.1 hypothetical protein [Vibrio parahaemolyticus]ELA9213036.1 hypothetical protein [Vibrio parahaemolyticus]MBD6980866.1 hypothetical protein [Vibrio parahaemolyticus]
MSAVIKTTTPFVIEEVLLEALTAVGAEPVRIASLNQQAVRHIGGLLVGDILTNRSDYYGPQHFRFDGKRWILRHDSSEMNGRISSMLAEKHYSNVGRFLGEVGSAYEVAYQGYVARIAEQERIRLEEERKARVEATRQQAIAKAKAQGYSIKETTNSKGQIQLVLTRMV